MIGVVGRSFMQVASKVVPVAILGLEIAGFLEVQRMKGRVAELEKGKKGRKKRSK